MEEYQDGMVKVFLQYIQFEASFGKHIWLWQDCWCDDEYDSSTNREASVDSLLLRQTKGRRGVEMLGEFGFKKDLLYQ